MNGIRILMLGSCLVVQLISACSAGEQVSRDLGDETAIEKVASGAEKSNDIDALISSPSPEDRNGSEQTNIPPSIWKPGVVALMLGRPWQSGQFEQASLQQTDGQNAMPEFIHAVMNSDEYQMAWADRAGDRLFPTLLPIPWQGLHSTLRGLAQSIVFETCKTLSMKECCAVFAADKSPQICLTEEQNSVNTALVDKYLADSSIKSYIIEKLAFALPFPASMPVDSDSTWEEVVTQYLSSISQKQFEEFIKSIENGAAEEIKTPQIVTAPSPTVSAVPSPEQTSTTTPPSSTPSSSNPSPGASPAQPLEPSSDAGASPEPSDVPDPSASPGSPKETPESEAGDFMLRKAQSLKLAPLPLAVRKIKYLSHQNCTSENGCRDCPDGAQINVCILDTLQDLPEAPADFVEKAFSVNGKIDDHPVTKFTDDPTVFADYKTKIPTIEVNLEAAITLGKIATEKASIKSKFTEIVSTYSDGNDNTDQQSAALERLVSDTGVNLEETLRPWIFACPTSPTIEMEWYRYGLDCIFEAVNRGPHSSSNSRTGNAIISALNDESDWSARYADFYRTVFRVFKPLIDFGEATTIAYGQNFQQCKTTNNARIKSFRERLKAVDLEGFYEKLRQANSNQSDIRYDYDESSRRSSLANSTSRLGVELTTAETDTVVGAFSLLQAPGLYLQKFMDHNGYYENDHGNIQNRFGEKLDQIDYFSQSSLPVCLDVLTAGPDSLIESNIAAVESAVAKVGSAALPTEGDGEASP